MRVLPAQHSGGRETENNVQPKSNQRVESDDNELHKHFCAGSVKLQLLVLKICVFGDYPLPAGISPGYVDAQRYR